MFYSFLLIFPLLCFCLSVLCLLFSLCEIKASFYVWWYHGLCFQLQNPVMNNVFIHTLCVVPSCSHVISWTAANHNSETPERLTMQFVAGWEARRRAADIWHLEYVENNHFEELGWASSAHQKSFRVEFWHEQLSWDRKQSPQRKDVGGGRMKITEGSWM